MKILPYTYAQKILHWLSSAVIIWTLISGFYISSVEVPTSTKNWLELFNVSLTTLFIPFFIVRIYLFLRHHHQLRKAGARTVERLASFVHSLIYAMISTILVTGVLMMNHPINIFNLITIPQPLDALYWTSLFFTLHIWACIGLSSLVILHILALVKHEISGRRILANMWSRS